MRRMIFAAFLIFIFAAGSGKAMDEMKYKPLERLSIDAIEERFYRNPSVIKGIGDPFVLKASDGMYYCYATSAKDGYRAWVSDDMANWTYAGMPFIRTPRAWCLSEFWAPEVLERSGKYYMYYTARDARGHLQIGVAVADHPKGPFVDKGAPLIGPAFSVLDASPFVDDDGRIYLYYVRDCSENVVDGRHESHIYVTRLGEDLVSTLGEPILLTTPEQEWELNGGSDWLWNEGPIVHKHGGKYYLMYSANFYGGLLYSVGYAVSDNPMGPFEKGADNPVLRAVLREGKPLVSGPGHHSYAFSPDETEMFCAYHSHTDVSRPGGDRQACIDRMGYRADGTLYICGPTLYPQPLPSGVGGVSNAAARASDIRADSQAQSALGVIDGDIGGSGSMSGAYEWVSERGVGAWVELRFDAPQCVDAVLLYPSGVRERRIAEVNLYLNDEYVIPGVAVEDSTEPGYAARVHFPEIELHSLRVEVLALAEGAERAGLAEIYVMGQWRDANQ